MAVDWLIKPYADWRQSPFTAVTPCWQNHPCLTCPLSLRKRDLASARDSWRSSVYRLLNEAFRKIFNERRLLVLNRANLQIKSNVISSNLWSPYFKCLLPSTENFLSGCHGHLYLRQKVSDNFEWKRHVLQAVMSELCILLKYENLIITRITSQIEIQFLIKVIVVINIKPTIS